MEAVCVSVSRNRTRVRTGHGPLGMSVDGGPSSAIHVVMQLAQSHLVAWSALWRDDGVHGVHGIYRVHGGMKECVKCMECTESMEG